MSTIEDALILRRIPMGQRPEIHVDRVIIHMADIMGVNQNKNTRQLESVAMPGAYGWVGGEVEGKARKEI